MLFKGPQRMSLAGNAAAATSAAATAAAATTTQVHNQGGVTAGAQRPSPLK